MTDDDKRFDDRVPFAAELLVVRDDAAWRAELTDLSAGGCGAFRPADCDLEEDALVRLFFLAGPGRAVAVDARVARDDPRRIGFEYHEPQAIPPRPRAPGAATARPD
jgi:hypothetical protein